MIEALKGYANAGEYGCYITTLDDDKALEEYNAQHPDTPIDIEAFKRGETAIAGKDTEYNAPNTALVEKTLTLTADSTDGKATDFKIGGAFYYDDYSNRLSQGIDRRKFIDIVPNIIFVSESGMERLTKEPIISAIGVDMKDINDLERIDSELQVINSTLTASEWQFKSAVNQKELFEQTNYSLSFLGNGAAILLIVIGLINFVNVMLTGAGKRKTKWLPTGLPVKGNKKKAEKMLMETRQTFVPECKPIQEDMLFSDFLLQWLEIAKPTIALATYASYSGMAKSVIIPYFKEREITLSEMKATDIQAFYMKQLKRVKANSVIHYHAVIHRALKYAVKIDLISVNPADKVERPKADKFIGSFYDSN